MDCTCSLSPPGADDSVVTEIRAQQGVVTEILARQGVVTEIRAPTVKGVWFHITLVPFWLSTVGLTSSSVPDVYQYG